MPPRFAYWTLLIDDAPTAFRARDAADLLPTLHQLKRKNPNVVLKWFSGGRLWDSPEAARDARRRPPAAIDKRGPAWRPGGKHADPRDRFRKKKDGPRRDGPGKDWPRKDGPRAERAARPLPTRPLSSTRAPRPFGSSRPDRPFKSTRPERPVSSTRRPPPPAPPRRNGPPKGRGGPPRRTK